MQKIVDSHKKIAILNSFFILSLSLLIILIWQFDLVTIKGLFPGNQISNPVTALCFTASVISFFLLVNNNTRLHLPGKILAAAVFFTGLIRFSEIILDFSTGIDRWLYPHKLFLYGNNGNPNFMAPNTALAFAFLGASLLFYRFRIQQKNKLADFFALTVAFFSFVSMIGYLYNSGEFYKVKSYIPMAFPTALSFLVCSTSILFYRSDFGFFSVFTTKYSGGKIARFLVPFAIAVPVITGLMNVYGEELKLYSPSFGVAFFTTVNIITFLILIWRCSIYLNRSGKALASMEEQLRSFNRELEQKVVEGTDEIVKNKQRFRSLIENSADMVSIVDKDNKLSYVSPSIEKIMGIQAHELACTPPYSLVHPDFVELITALNSAIRKQHGGSKTIRLKVRHQDGHYIWIEGTITNLLDDENIRGIVNNFHDITEQVEAEEQKKLLEQALVDEKIHQQKELMRATIDGQEKEKKQIGMELHDNITQILASANIYLSVCGAGKENREQLIEKARQQIAYAISELRGLSKSLVPHGIESGGVMEAIEDIIDTVRLLSETKCHSTLSQPAFDHLNQRGQLAVYRIIQEQLNNILKHAQASNIYVTLLEENNCIRLCIEDDGKGFDTASRRAGIGLSNIKSRAQLLNGEMKIESAIGAGCKLFITFPAYQANASQKSLIPTKY